MQRLVLTSFPGLDDRSDYEISADNQTEWIGKMALTKAELAEILYEKVGLNKREAKDMVDSFFEELSLALERGENIKLSGFGNFVLRDKPQRPGRNPKTGEEMTVSASRVTTFHASTILKSAVCHLDNPN